MAIAVTVIALVAAATVSWIYGVYQLCCGENGSTEKRTYYRNMLIAFGLMITVMWMVVIRELLNWP
ncbi:MAG TPA: hypothetical protein VHE81_18290 [Lacipirellulaceae bacterium]|nr:hypothetical protein [Lacipirellulaceae bacterium]